MKKMPIILDTDIGGDIDDVLALAYLLNSPEADLLALTTVNTDPSMRARIAAKVLRAYGRPDIPVAPGLTNQFDGSATRCKDINAAVVVTLDDAVPTGDGVELITKTIRAHPGEVTVVGIGPWSNIATAFKKDPDLAKMTRQIR